MLRHISVNLCDPHPDNPRENFEDEGILASIREHGILTPVIVWGRPGGRYIVLAGHRRTFASSELGKETIPAVVYAGNELTEEKAQFILLEENIKHKTLEPVEEARAIASRIKKFGLSQQKIAEEYRRSQGWVSQRLSLLPAHERPEPKVSGRPRNESPGLIKPLISPLSPVSTSNAVRSAPIEAQPAVAKAVENQKLSANETASLVKAVKEAPPEKQKEIAEKAAESSSPIAAARELAGKANREKRVEEERRLIEAGAACPDLVWEGSIADRSAELAGKYIRKICGFLSAFEQVGENNGLTVRYDTCPSDFSLESYVGFYDTIRKWASRHHELALAELNRRQSGKRATVTHLRPVSEAAVDG